MANLIGVIRQPNSIGFLACQFFEDGHDVLNVDQTRIDSSIEHRLLLATGPSWSEIVIDERSIEEMGNRGHVIFCSNSNLGLQASFRKAVAL